MCDVSVNGHCCAAAHCFVNPCDVASHVNLDVPEAVKPSDAEHGFGICRTAAPC